MVCKLCYTESGHYACCLCTHWGSVTYFAHISFFHNVAWLALATSILWSLWKSLFQLAGTHRLLLTIMGYKGDVCSGTQWSVKDQVPSQASEDYREESRAWIKLILHSGNQIGEMCVSLQPCCSLCNLFYIQNTAETDANENNRQKHF